MSDPLNDRVADDGMTFVGFANMLLRQRRVIMSAALLGCAAYVGLSLLRGQRTWTSSSSFIPQARRQSTTLSGLAAQFGVALPASEAAQSTAFYADLVESRRVLGEVIDMPITGPDREGRRRPMSVLAFLNVRGENEAERRDRAIRKLAAAVTANVVVKTGVVRVSVTLPDSGVARQVNDLLLRQLDRYNQQTRNSQAAAERRFTQRRLLEVQTEMRAAENRLQSFLQHNRDFRNSPELSFEQDRLSRDVAMRQQVFASLAQANEQARIEEVRDTPVLTVVEPPQAPVSPNPRGTLKKILIGLLGGALIGLIIALAREFLRVAEEGAPGEFAELERLRREAWRDVRNPIRALRRG